MARDPHTPEQTVPEPSSFGVEVTVEKLKKEEITRY
jgi:hypothetical protein